VRKLAAALTVAVVVVTAFVQSALATSYDLSPATDSVQSQFSDVLVYVLPIAGGLLAVMVAWRFIRRIVRT